MRNKPRRKEHGLKQRLQNGRKGFSLVELIIVIAIMAVLVGVLTPSLLQWRDKAEEAKMRQEFDGLIRAGELFMADQMITGFYDKEANFYDQENILVNRGSVVALDKAATQYFQEIYPDRIKVYAGMIAMERETGRVVKQIWQYIPEGSDIMYEYNTDNPGVIEEKPAKRPPSWGK